MWYLIFSIAVVLFLLWCIVKSGQNGDHLIESDLVIPPGTESKDETQILYFATGKGFVDAEQIQ